VFTVHLDVNFQFFNQRMHFFVFIFVFLFNSPYICFGRDSAIIRGTLIRSLHCSLVQRHSALYSQFTVLYYILQTQDKYYIHQDISRNYLKKLCILVITNVNNSLKQCNGSVIIPNGPVNSEVNLSMYPWWWPSHGRNMCRVNLTEIRK
jgi:hypothetical protein